MNPRCSRLDSFGPEGVATSTHRCSLGCWAAPSPPRPGFCFLADSGFIIPGNKKDIHQVFLGKYASYSLHEEGLRLQRGQRGGSTGQCSAETGSKRHKPHPWIGTEHSRYLERNRAFCSDALAASSWSRLLPAACLPHTFPRKPLEGWLDKPLSTDR